MHELLNFGSILVYQCTGDSLGRVIFVVHRFMLDVVRLKLLLQNFYYLLGIREIGRQVLN